MQPDIPKGLLCRVFWHNAFELALLHGGEHYDLKMQHFVKRKDGGIDIIFYQSKCNQVRLSNSNPKSEVISIVYYSLISYWYKSVHVGRNTLNGFMNEIASVTGINCDNRKFSNHSGRKTFVQYSKSKGISDNDVMSVSRHKNPHSLSYYKRPKTVLQQNTLPLVNDTIYKNSVTSGLNNGNLPSDKSLQQLWNFVKNMVIAFCLKHLSHLLIQEIKESQNIQLDNDSIKEFLLGNTFNNCNITFNVQNQ